MDTPGPALVAAAVPAEPGRMAPADSHARWRYELERAQAQLRAPAVAGSAASARAPVAVAGIPGVASAEAGAPGAARSRAPGADAPATGARSPAGSGNAAALPAAQRTDRTPPGAGATAGARTPTTVPPGPALSTAAPRTLAQSAPWPSVNAHVSIRGGLATVWIRDAHLTRETLAQLERDVRARLRALGAKLEALFVNGRRVEPIGASQDPLQNPTGGQDGD